MAAPFEAILKHEDIQYVICENPYFVAVLEQKPLVLGHVVVISKTTEDYLLDLADEALQSLLSFSKPIAKAIAKFCPCRKVGIAVIGLETRHAHLHLVPMNTSDDLNFTRDKLSPSHEILRNLARDIRSQVGPTVAY